MVLQASCMVSVWFVCGRAGSCHTCVHPSSFLSLSACNTKPNTVLTHTHTHPSRSTSTVTAPCGRMTACAATGPAACVSVATMRCQCPGWQQSSRRPRRARPHRAPTATQRDVSKVAFWVCGGGGGGVGAAKEGRGCGPGVDDMVCLQLAGLDSNSVQGHTAP